MQFITSSFETRRDQYVIRGNCFRPAREEAGKTAVISHGFMDNREGVRRYAELLAGIGYTCFTFDFCGGCVKGESDGASTDMTVFTELRDLEAVTEYARKETGTEQLLIMGCSQGGFVSALYAAAHPDGVQKLVLFYPALCIPDDARRGRMMFARFKPDQIPDTIRCGPMTLGRGYAESVQGIDAIEEISGYTGPVLIVHGSKDRVVRLNYARRAYEMYRAAQKGEKNCELVIMQGAGHGFKGMTDFKAQTLVREFLARSVPFEGIRTISGMFGPDLVRKQMVYDNIISKNEYHLDDRYVIRDGKRHPFALIIPGGGFFTVCSFIEGVPYAKKLNDLGISAFILYYHVKKFAHYPAPQKDVAQAVREIRARADEYMVAADGYSLWGSSAGGYLAASFGTEHMGYKKYNLPAPSAIVLAYPVISMNPALTHGDTRANHIGKGASAERENYTSIDLNVTAAYPPTYIWCGDSDSTVPAENTRRMAAALEKAGVPHECRIFRGVDHGVGPGTGTVAEGWIREAAAFVHWQAEAKTESTPD